VGEHHLVIGGEVDCAEALRGGKLGHYMELKTTRLMDTAPQIMRFERDKLIKWWAQSFPVGVLKILVGFRDDHGQVKKVQVMDTLKLPKHVAGKSHGWDANGALGFLDRALTWLREAIADHQRGPSASGAMRYVMKYEPQTTPGVIALVHDPSIPPFAPTHLLSHKSEVALPPDGIVASESKDDTMIARLPHDGGGKGDLEGHVNVGDGATGVAAVVPEGATRNKKRDREELGESE
ncbi:hypothetical protein CYMTET_13139, partial [Cymbomonas tetramitiformis]